MFRSTRVTLMALLLTVPLFVIGVRPTMAQAVIGVDNVNPLAPLPEGAPAAGGPPAEEGQPDGGAPAEGNGGAADTEAESLSSVAAPTTYVVQAKDTMFSIARRHGVSVDAILWANDLTDPNVLKEGQTLTIPPSSGTLYTIKKGDTLASVSQAHGVSTMGIATVNGLTEDASLVAGRQLLIPAPRQAVAPDPASSPVTLSAAQAAPPVPVPSPSATPSPSSTSDGASSQLVATAAPLVKPTASPAPTGTPSATVTTRKLPTLEWPISLKSPTTGITQQFRPGHTGIDIGVPAGTPIKAMAAGVVKRADKGDNGGYGWLVVVDHGEGITTWYAHLSEFAVSVGDKVQVGQKLGEAGTTGRSTGPHLHFELRINSTPIDPLLALPE